MEETFEYITFESRPDSLVASVTLNRPEKHNALNEQAQLELLAALEKLGVDNRVVIITGAGEKAFCAGVDLKELPQQQARSQRSRNSDTWLQVCMRMLELPCVFIAAVNGYALGGGLTLVNVADLAIAAEHASFGMPEVGFGAFPRLAGPSTARRLLPKHVSWMALTASHVDSKTAQQWGLVNEVVPASQLAMRVMEIAMRIAKFDSAALAWTKRGLLTMEKTDLRSSLEFGSYVRAMIMKDQAEK